MLHLPRSIIKRLHAYSFNIVILMASTDPIGVIVHGYCAVHATEDNHADVHYRLKKSTEGLWYPE